MKYSGRLFRGINKLEQLPCFHLIWELMFDIIDAGFSLE